MLPYRVIPILAGFFISSAYATTINYTATSLGGNQWRYDYTLANNSLQRPITEFTIFFDLGLYSNLATTTSPQSWSVLAIQPDPNIPDGGFFDALSMSNGLAPGSSLGGFQVIFNWLGSSAPGAQRFDVIDPSSFTMLDTGRTVNPIPEPGSTSLIFLGLGCISFVPVFGLTLKRTESLNL